MGVAAVVERCRHGQRAPHRAQRLLDRLESRRTVSWAQGPGSRSI